MHGEYWTILLVSIVVLPSGLYLGFTDFQMLFLGMVLFTWLAVMSIVSFFWNAGWVEYWEVGLVPLQGLWGDND